jgi:hypothetical protein
MDEDILSQPPSATFPTSDPTINDSELRAYLDQQNADAAALWGKIAATDDERERVQLYSDAFVIVYRAAFTVTNALLMAREQQLRHALDSGQQVSDALTQARTALSKARDEAARARADLETQRVLDAHASGDNAPIVVNVTQAGVQRIERDDAGRVTRVVREGV